MSYKYKCSICKRESAEGKKYVLVICPCCQEEMKLIDELQCEHCNSTDLIEFNPREQHCSEGEECEYIAHEINNETCFSCNNCGSYAWFNLNDEANYNE